MKKITTICALGLGILAAVSCCNSSNEVTAVVAGPEQKVIALDIDYEAPVCPKSVCAEAFEVSGHEVACVKACEDHVILILKGNCPKAECGEGKPACDKAVCPEGKPECDKPCKGPKPECEGAEPCEKKCDAEQAACEKKCDKAGAKDCDKCGKCDKPCKGPKPECEGAEPCGKKCDAEQAACEKKCDKAGAKDCDKCGKCDKPEGKCCGKPECCGKENCAAEKPCCKEGKPECEGAESCEKKCDAEQAACEKKCDKAGADKCKKGGKECKVAVPKISVKQVADIKDVEGNVIPAWKKAAKASDVKVAHHGRHHGGHACKEGKPECKGHKAECDKPCKGPKPECTEGKPECGK